jgi:hypothetical protein
MDAKILVELMKAIGAAAVTTAVIAVIISSWRRSPSSWITWGWIVAIAAGSYVGWFILGGRPAWPPKEPHERFLTLVFPAFLAAELWTSSRRPPGWVRWSVRGAVAAAAGPVLLSGSSYLLDLAGPGSREWSPALATLILGTLGAALVGEWALLDRDRGDRRPLLAIACLAVALCGASLTIMLSGSATSGALGLPMAAAACGCLATGPLARRAADEAFPLVPSSAASAGCS